MGRDTIYRSSLHREDPSLWKNFDVESIDDVHRAFARFSSLLHIMGPRFDTRYVTLVLRVGRRHVWMAHLRARVRVMWIVGRGYVLHRRKWRLKLMVSDNVRLRSVFPRRLGSHRLFRAVSFVRSLHLLLVSVEYPLRGGSGRRGYVHRRHLRPEILVQLVVLDFALLEVQRKIQTNAGQRPETVQLTLFD